MPFSTSTLLTRNLQDVFGENDAARRRAAIDEIWTEDGGDDQGYSPCLSISANFRSRGIGQRRSGPLGSGPPW